MRNYEVVTPLRLQPGKKPVQPGKVVELDQVDGEPLVALGALRHAPTSPAKASPKPLLDEPIEELRKIAKREKVELPADADAATAAAFIQAKRDGKPPPTAGGSDQGGSGEGGNG